MPDDPTTAPTDDRGQQTADPTANTDPPEAAQSTDDQGDAGKPNKPVTDWEAEARKWEKRSKENFARLKEAEPKLAEFEQIVAARKTDAERQAEELTRWQTEAEKWRAASITARIEAIASVDFADPSDAVGALTPEQYLDAGGTINEDAIRKDLAAVLERKPHWRRPETPQTRRPPAPNHAQGTSGAGAAMDPRQEFAAILQQQLNSPR